MPSSFLRGQESLTLKTLDPRKQDAAPFQPPSSTLGCPCRVPSFQPGDAGYSPGHWSWAEHVDPAVPEPEAAAPADCVPRWGSAGLGSGLDSACSYILVLGIAPHEPLLGPEPRPAMGLMGQG